MPSTFLDAVADLPHRERMRRLVALGRSTEPDDRALIAALADGDAYARGLALATVFGSRDGAHAARALADPSRTVRRRAVRLAARLSTDDQLANALRNPTDPTIVGRVLRTLRKRGRLAVIDRILAAIPGPERTDLLPLGSPDRALEPLITHGSTIGWARLAVRHPTVARDHLVERITRAGASDLRLSWRVNAVLPALVNRDPDAALAVVAARLGADEDPNGWVTRRALVRLARLRPVQTFDLMRRRHGATPIVPAPVFSTIFFDKGVRQLGAERLVWLVTHAWGALRDGHRGHVWFGILEAADQRAVVDAWLARGLGGWGGFLLAYAPPGEARERAYIRWSTAARDRDGMIADTVLDGLPADLRHREARRHLTEVERLAVEPLRRLGYARLLPFDEARAVIAPFLGHPEGDTRALALRAWIGTVRHERRSVGAALEAVVARRYEQDPVRLAMLNALVALPERCFDASHLPALATIVQHAVDAADLSPGSAACCERLIVGRLKVDPLWVADRLNQLLAVRGTLSAPLIGLTPTEAVALAPALTAMADRWTTKERAYAVWWLANGLGPQLRRVPGVLAALERLATEQPFVHVAWSVLTLLRRATPRQFGLLAERLVDADPSYVAIPDVARHLSLVAQDRLGPLLAAGPMTGRWATGRTAWVVDFQVGHARWSASQQRLHAGAWAGVLADPTTDVRTARNAVGSLLKLAYADPAPLLAAASDARLPVREITIRGLPHLDAGEGVPILVECLGDERARYAIYALRAAFRELTRTAVLARLRAVSLGKVTVAKEVIRLLGELGGDEAFADLVALDRGDLHRDVRIALLRALWDHLERDETWRIFEAAAQAKDWVVASRLADVPVGRLSPVAERRLTGLLTRLFRRPEPEARLELLGRAGALPLTDPDRVLFGGLLEVVASGRIAEAELAWSAVRVRLWPGDVEAVVARFVARSADRRWLAAMVRVTEGWLAPYLSGAPKTLLDAVIRTLANDPIAVVPYLRLAVRAWSGGPLADALIAVSRSGNLHADAVAITVEQLPGTAHPWIVEQRLREEADPYLRRIAVRALEVAAGPERGWTAERLAQLARYRVDPSGLVAGAAAFVFPPEAGVTATVRSG